MKPKSVSLMLLFFFILLLTSCKGTTDVTGPESVTQATESRYSENEIREYEGVRLDPSVGPRDNSIKGIQTIDINAYTLKVTGLVKQPLNYTYQEVLKLPVFERLITLYCVEGWDATVLWEGTRIEDIIQTAGVQPSANTLIFHCVDGYTTSLPLKTVLDGDLLLAYKSNGIELPAALGFPFIVVAEDKLGYKWARWVEEIELSDNEDYKGYWEGYGYDNDADLK